MFNGLKSLEDFFDFNNSNKEHFLFSIVNNVGVKKSSTPESIWSDKFVLSRSNTFSFNCGIVCKTTLKGLTEPVIKTYPLRSFINALMVGSTKRKFCDRIGESRFLHGKGYTKAFKCFWWSSVFFLKKSKLWTVGKKLQWMT